ncbi:MAG: universal stress protein [Bacteroidales bacterium]|nr:universal stress protein [Bacteroidales bacterium]
MMSQIIVGIDFSNSSMVALRLAVDIANRTGADILLAWVENKEIDIEEAQKELHEIALSYTPKLNGKKISYIVCKGRVYQAMANLAKSENPDLIVIGAHGRGGFDEKYAGQNTFKIVTECETPVLIIRETFNFDKHLEKIILPIDSSRDTRQKVPWTIEFAKMFPKSHICVLGVQTTRVQTVRNEVVGYVKSVETFLTKHELPHTVEYVDAENNTTSIIEYAKNMNADLIVVMTEQEKTISNMLFLGPYSQQMINLSPLPVLIVPAVQLHGAAK